MWNAQTGGGPYVYETVSGGKRPQLCSQQIIGRSKVPSRPLKEILQLFQAVEPGPPSIVASGLSDNILFAAYPCVRSDRSVSCAISVTNQSASERWESIQPASSLLENSGDQHFPSDIRGPNNYLPNHAMNIRLTFSGVSPSARTCTLNIRHHGNGEHSEIKSVILDKVPIE